MAWEIKIPGTDKAVNLKGKYYVGIEAIAGTFMLGFLLGLAIAETI